MIRAILLTLVYGGFLVCGAAVPFVLVLGYVWVDGANPQFLTGSGILPLLQVSFIMGSAAVASYVLMDRRSPPRFNFATFLVIVFALWVTFTTVTLAEVPNEAWPKWNIAIKTLLFSAFLPYAIRSRVQIEAFLQVFLFSTAVYFIPAGLKTLVSGGGYGQELTMIGGDNSGLAEGSTLAGVSLMLIPIMFYLADHSLLIESRVVRKVGYACLSLAALAAAIGTYERTALVGLVVVGVFMWLRSRHKFSFGILLAMVGMGIIYFAAASWTARISTINDYSQESSALGRILVWKWTLGYVAQHPLGGGFNVFNIDHIYFPDGSEAIGKAFHSIYFEVLGEQGFPGLFLFIGLLVYTLVSLRKIARQTRKNPDMRWASSLGGALEASLLTLLACGAVIGIAFQPFIYYLIAMTISLREQVRRCGMTEVEPKKVWQPAIGSQTGAIPWRDRAQHANR